jgi:hypothetical protein
VSTALRKLLPTGAHNSSTKSSGATAAQLGEYVHIQSLCCGAAFTVAVDVKGDLYSWGWNESGVLGHGVRHFSSGAQVVGSIGASFDGCKVKQVSAGGKHVVALTESQGHSWASTYHSILESGKKVDCMIVIEDRASAIKSLAAKFNSAGSGGSGDGTAAAVVSFPCHKAILSARSRFLAGFIATAEKERRSVLQQTQADALRSAHDDDDDPWDPLESSDVLQITLPSLYATANSVRSLLAYIYMDRVHVLQHKREELANLAAALQMDRLYQILMGSSYNMHTLNKAFPSQFTQQMDGLFNTPMCCDVVLVLEHPKVPKPHHSTADHEDGDDNGNDEDEGGKCLRETLSLFDPSQYAFVLYAHQVVLSNRLPFFDVLLSGRFADTRKRTLLPATTPSTGSAGRSATTGAVDVTSSFSLLHMLADSTTSSNNTNAIATADINNYSPAVVVDVSGFLEEGISVETLSMVLRFAYTGQFTPCVGNKGDSKGTNNFNYCSYLNCVIFYDDVFATKILQQLVAPQRKSRRKMRAVIWTCPSMTL